MYLHELVPGIMEYCRYFFFGSDGVRRRSADRTKRMMDVLLLFTSGPAPA